MVHIGSGGLQLRSDRVLRRLYSGRSYVRGQVYCYSRATVWYMIHTGSGGLQLRYDRVLRTSYYRRSYDVRDQVYCYSRTTVWYMIHVGPGRLQLRAHSLSVAVVSASFVSGTRRQPSAAQLYVVRRTQAHPCYT